MEEQAHSLLGGYRVLDLTDEKGLLCGKILGDLGADVIKVEPPGGERARNHGPFCKDAPHPEKSLFWFYTNLNKRGITLDIKTIDGKEIFEKLVQTADFVIESFEPGYMDSLGLGYEALEKINPRLIMTSVTPFGQTGPYAHYKAPDLVGVAMGGMMRPHGYADTAPLRFSAPQFYFLGSIHGAMGSMVAHYHRELTGEGQYVDVSCQQAVVLSLMVAAETWDLLRVNQRGMGPYAIGVRPTPPGPLLARRMWSCKDGYVYAMVSGGAAAGIATSTKRMVEMANREGMALELKDMDWTAVNTATLIQEEVNRWERLMSAFFRTKTKQELLDEAVKKSMMLMPVSTIKDVVESPQLEAREFWVQVEHSELDETIIYPGWPIKMSGLPPYRPQRRAPLIGEHNEEVFEKELGLSKEQVVILKTRGVI